jgi:hypothetical protein
MIRYTYIFLALLLINTGLNAQAIRTAAMGGLGYSVIDEDNSLTPYDFGGNPAWLMNDQQHDWLRVIPSVENSHGDYKRTYDAQRTSDYNVLFRGVKVLEDGTFLGETSYEYEYRKAVPKSLKYNTYNGEAFYMNDTTTGNFRYHGPSMKFMYSFEPIDNLFAGASANYKILNGLKSIYSRAETLYRDVNCNAGIAYKFNNYFVAGATVSFEDEQEKITADSDDLLDVEIFNYRGDTYYITRRAASVTNKFKEKTVSGGLQFYYKPADNIEVGLSGDISQAKDKLLMPYSDSDGSYDEYEGGYSSFNTYDAKVAARYCLSDKIIISAEAGYYERKSWSKNSTLDLLLWEWDIQGFKAGAGASYKITDKILLAAEYTFASNKADSSKYADSRYFNKTSGDNLVKIGCEAELLKDVYFRAGYNYGTKEIDLVYGGGDVKFNLITLGVGLQIFRSFCIDMLVTYNDYKPGNIEVSRTGFTSYLALKLFSF